MTRCDFCNLDAFRQESTLVRENGFCLFASGAAREGESQSLLWDSGIIVPKVHRETVLDLSPDEFMATRDLLLSVRPLLEELSTRWLHGRLELFRCLWAGRPARSPPRPIAVRGRTTCREGDPLVLSTAREPPTRPLLKGALRDTFLRAGRLIRLPLYAGTVGEVSAHSNPATRSH